MADSEPSTMPAGAEDLVEEKKDEETEKKEEDELLDYDEEGNPMRPPIGREDGDNSDSNSDDRDWCNYSVVDEVDDEESNQSERHLAGAELLAKREHDRCVADLNEEREASAGLDEDERDPEVIWRVEVRDDPMPMATTRLGLGQWGSLKSYAKGASHYNPYDKAVMAEKQSYNNPNFGTGMAQESREYTSNRRERSRLLNRRRSGSSSPSYDSEEVRRMQNANGG